MNKLSSLLYRIKNRLFSKRIKGIVIYGRCNFKVSKKANINIGKRLIFNGDINGDKIWKKFETGRLLLEDNSNLVVNTSFRFASGCYLTIGSGAKLLIEGDGYANYNSSVYCRDQITIGKGVYISQNVVIRDSDVHTIANEINHAPIFIGDHVWIGTNAIILKGVTIGEGAIIGAGSIVTHDVPPHCVAAGNPAKVIQTNVEWN